jgi:cobalt/nickel transport system permease protein
MLGIILQAIIFGHGGITVIGINSLMLGGGALIAYIVWQQRHHFSFNKRELVFGALAGAIGTISSGTVLALALITTGKEFNAIAGTVLVAHIPIMIIEAAVVGACAEFLNKVKPDILAGQRKPGIKQG